MNSNDWYQSDIVFANVNLPAYDLFNFGTGVEGDMWSAYLFANNLADKPAWLSTNNPGPAWTAPTIIRLTTNQPRTVGMDLQYRS